jgi:Transglutaminase-like superfamily
MINLLLCVAQLPAYESDFKKVVQQNFSTNHLTLSSLSEIYLWIKHSFKCVPLGGSLIGIKVDEIYKTKRISGCHDQAALFAAIIKEMGFPAVLVETTGINFSKEVLKNPQAKPIGHVFVEVCLDNKWVLIDPGAGLFVLNYQPENPVIPIAYIGQTEGFYVMAKGGEYPVPSLKEVLNLQMEFAKKINWSEIVYPAYIVGKL